MYEFLTVSSSSRGVFFFKTLLFVNLSVVLLV
jgi:hypothetical protein